MKRKCSIFVLAMLFMLAFNVQSSREMPTDTFAVPGTPAIYQARMTELTVADRYTWLSTFYQCESMPGFLSSDSILGLHNLISWTYGLNYGAIGAELDNDNRAIMFADIPSVQQAKRYDTLPASKDMLNAKGIIGTTAPLYWNVMMDDVSGIAQHERMMVVQHVKDFATWKQVFDAEGKASRQKNGFYERLIARGVDDSNLVCLIFAITDMDKTKARMASPKLKWLMAHAGVDSPPQIIYFRWLNR